MTTRIGIFSMLIVATAVITTASADEIGGGITCLQLCPSQSGEASLPEQASSDLWQQLLEWFDIDLAEDE